MTHHHNKLASSNHLPRTALTPIATGDLDNRFMFQNYGDEDQHDAARPDTARRALLDKRLLEELYEQLCTQPQFETRDVSLRAHNGVVTIDGIVSSRAMRAQIANFIRTCPFVKNVINRMRTHDAFSAVGGWNASAESAWRSSSIAA